jgi:hypothetical protein
MDYQKLTFTVAIVGDRGGPNSSHEVSISAAWDLGYSVAEANPDRGPVGSFGIMYLPGTSSIAYGANTIFGLVSIFIALDCG